MFVYQIITFLCLASYSVSNELESSLDTIKFKEISHDEVLPHPNELEDLITLIKKDNARRFLKVPECEDFIPEDTQNLLREILKISDGLAFITEVVINDESSVDEKDDITCRTTYLCKISDLSDLASATKNRLTRHYKMLTTVLKNKRELLEDISSDMHLFSRMRESLKDKNREDIAKLPIYIKLWNKVKSMCESRHYKSAEKEKLMQDYESEIQKLCEKEKALERDLKFLEHNDKILEKLNLVKYPNIFYSDPIVEEIPIIFPLASYQSLNQKGKLVRLMIQDNTGILIKFIFNHMSLLDLVIPVTVFDVANLEELDI